MKVTWLRQCVYELKQENEELKAELAAIRAKLGME
jgi:ribosomal protein L29